MKKILIVGAGKSSTYLIDYLIRNAREQDWEIAVGDLNQQLALAHTQNKPRTRAFAFDVLNDDQRNEEIAKADIIVSMLPPGLHMMVANDCLVLKRHLATASYVSEQMRDMHEEVKAADLVFLNEMGLDPGLDHMSAMELIQKFRSEGRVIKSFKSYTGGLIAPENNTNSWGYKFSWNPRNVILAGQGLARFKENGNIKYLPYQRLFEEHETISVKGLGDFDGYANRDSLGYQSLYDLEEVDTLIRGTLRYSGFCKAWNVFVQLGLTDDTYKIKDLFGKNYCDLLERYLPAGSLKVKESFETYLDERFDKKDLLPWFEELGWFDEEPIDRKEASPAELLQQLLEKKWKLEEEDKDMIVMQHEFVTENESGVSKRNILSLVVKGKDNKYTAMAKTVGLPLAVGIKLLLSGKIKERGVMIPVNKEFYSPVLKELHNYGIVFHEEEFTY